MKIIDSILKAQAMFGNRVSNGAENTTTRHPFTGSAWTAFLMPGNLPANEGDISAVFRLDSLADLYNKSMGVARGIASFVSKRNIVQLTPQAQYFYKGINFYRTVGNVNFSALIPHRVVEDADSKRCLTQLFAGKSLSAANGFKANIGSGSITIEFDNAVRISHIAREGTAMIHTVIAIADDGTETSLGTWPVYANDPTIYTASNPQTAKRFRVSVPLNNGNLGAITLLSDSEIPVIPTSILPGWVVVAHTNTRVCGDFQKSPMIPFIAESVGNTGSQNRPFTLRALQKENILYCPKIRFKNRSLP